ncbi:MAG: triple tyrosine motif-containing protein, partial [Bacteroidota bacterium]
RNYDASEGLQGNEYYWGASFKNADGSLMFGGINGLNIFYPKEIVDNQTTPPVVISDFLIYNRDVGIGKDSVLEKSISYTQSMTLSYKQSVLTFNFAALNYNHPEKNQYAYMMEGFEERWNNVGNKRTATYTNLDPGDYTFRVRASNNDNVWNENGVKLEITITPPFWKTWWFYALCAIGVIGFVYSFIKYRERQLNADKAELQRSIDKANAEVEQQKQNIADQRQKEKDRIWTDQGLVKFGEILSNSRDGIDELCHSVLKSLADYLDIQMAAIYLENEDVEGNLVLTIRSHYGYTGSESIMIRSGEGLVGECYKGKELNYIDNLPPGYLTISSGLGDCSPSSLFLVPLTYQGIIIGVLEMASFHPIEELKRDFVCTFTGRLTAAINTRLLGEKTQKLLDDSKVKAQELAVREEELKQNLEELQAMNEDRDRKTKELETNIKKLKAENGRLKKATVE